MKKIFNILVYLSLAFLVYYLFKQDYIQLEKIEFRWPYLVSSTFFLWMGFALSTFSWWYILKQNNIIIKKGDALIGHGLAVFGKYIPGKIWVILGRASYVSRFGHDIKRTSFLSLKEQLLYLWLGLFISSIPMFIFYGLDIFTLSVLGVFFGLTIFLFVPMVQNLILKLIKRVFKKEIILPKIIFKESLSVLFYISLYWIAWLIAFQLFVLSIFPEASISVAFAFPLSVTLGLMAIIFPGGIGVREGIITGYLVLTGIELETATMIAITSRLWFISGEIFIFLLALLWKVLYSKK